MGVALACRDRGRLVATADGRRACRPRAHRARNGRDDRAGTGARRAHGDDRRGARWARSRRDGPRKPTREGNRAGRSDASERRVARRRLRGADDSGCRRVRAAWGAERDGRRTGGSLHANHAENAAAAGAETWIAAPARDERSALVAARENLGAGSTSELADYVSQLLSDTKTEESRALADAIQDEIVSATGATDRGVKEAGFVVLLGLRVPSALVEMGFLTNADEAARLADASYRAKMAEGITSGIARYVRSHSYIP